MKLNEWKCDMDIDDVDIEPIGALKDMIDHFGLKYNLRTGSYDCDGDVNLYGYYNGLNATEQREFNAAFVMNGRMTIRFGEVKGHFILPGDCDNPYILTFLDGCPESVGNCFGCHYNQLTSLKGCPKTVGGWFDCGYNQLTSLAGCPKTVGGSFICTNNQLILLAGCPKTVGGSFDCRYNQLTSLKCCPKTVGGYFYCNNNKTKFTTDDVKSVCNVNGNIFV